MADPPLMNSVDVALRAEDQLVARGYALLFAEVLDEPFLEILLAMQMCAEPTGRHMASPGVPPAAPLLGPAVP
jgi:hypothetical protein